MVDNSKALGTAPVGTLLARYCVPSTLAMLVQALYAFVDAFFVGRFVGENGLAAVTLVLPIIVFCSGFGMLVGVGACSRISLLLGQRRLNDAEKTLGNAFSMIILFSIVMTACLLVLGTLFVESSHVSPEVRNIAKTFLWISISCGIIPSLMFGLNNIIRVQGNPRIAMGSIIFGFCLNSMLNPLFIAVFGWGAAGSALAKATAQAATTVWILYFLTSSRSLLKLKLKNMHLDWKICAPVLAIGLAPFLAQSAASLQGMILNIQLESYGEEVALAVSGVIYRVALIIFTVVMGIYQGAQPILGYNYGARQFGRVLRTLTLAIGVASVWCFSIVSLVLLFPVQTVAIVTQLTPELREICGIALRLSLAMCLLMGFQVVASQYFQTIGKPRLSIFLSLTRQVIFMIPALFLLPIAMEKLGFPGLWGIWGSFAFADLLSFLATACFFWRERWLLKTGSVKPTLNPSPTAPIVETSPSMTP